jgi:hypothetical protein
MRQIKHYDRPALDGKDAMLIIKFITNKQKKIQLAEKITEKYKVIARRNYQDRGSSCQ